MPRSFIPVPDDKTDAKQKIQEKADQEGKAMWEVLDEVFGSQETDDAAGSLEEAMFGEDSSEEVFETDEEFTEMF